jgi:hypothetical protein
MNRTMRQALNTAPAQGTNFVAIRENGFKIFKENSDGSPNPAYARLGKKQQAQEDAKPAYWGTWTRTPELPPLRAAAWERDASRYGPWASGNTQHPMTKEQAAAMQAGRPALNAPEPAKVPRAPKPRPADRDQNRA